jgi:hypothetical protein
MKFVYFDKLFIAFLTDELLLTAFQMDNGGSGFLLVVVSPVERGLSLGADSVTVQHL